MPIQKAKFSIGDIVKHKHFEFRGVIYDVDFEFNNSEEWYQSIPKNVRPKKDQPFYHLLAENDEITYEAYVSEQKAKFSIGDIVKHKHFEFRGVIYDVDFEFNNSEEWYQSIPKNVRPRKDQPFYHLLAENDEITYEAYVSEQNLLVDDSEEPIKHPLIEEIFSGRKGTSYFKPSN